MRTLLSLGVVLALTGGLTAADEKIDGKLLVGKWEQTSPEKGPKVTVEYTADGKLKASVNLGDGKEINVDGTYKLDGNTLTQTIKVGDKEQVRKVTITKLTADVLEGEGDKGMKNAFKRIKK